jgi:hypothetical protein
LAINPKPDGLFFDAVLDSAVESYFRVLRFQLVQDKSEALTLNLLNDDTAELKEITKYSKPTLFDKMVCHPTSKYVNCILHSIVNKQDGIYYLGYQRHNWNG